MTGARARWSWCAGAALWMAAPAAAQTSWGLGATTSGDLVFCDVRRDEVWKLDARGDLSVVLADTHCRNLVVGEDGAIYGESVRAGTTFDPTTGGYSHSALGLWRLGPSGRPAWVEPPTWTPDPSFWIIADHDGRSFGWIGAVPYSSQSGISRRERIGTRIVLAGGPWGQRDGVAETAQFGRVAGFAIAPDGTLVVADSGNIRRVTSVGQVTTESVGTISDRPGGLVGQPGLWDHTTGVATAADGSAVVVDYAALRIVHVARDGRANVLWRSGGLANLLTGSRWGWRPTGVALTGSGMYVMEDWVLPPLVADLVGTPRILRVHPDGSYDHVVSVSSWFVRGLVALAALVLLSWLRPRRWVRRLISLVTRPKETA